jgi:hypothetical protein
MPSIFNAVTAAVPVKTAAERYGLHLNHAGMARCPFHDDHTPSLKLNERYYYCFGCGATGDVVDLTAQLFGLQPYEAACKLAEDFDVNIEKPAGDYAGRPDSHLYVNRCRQVLAGYLDLLYRWKTRYRPRHETDTPDWRYAEACQMLDYNEYMALVLSSGTPAQRSLLAEKLTADGKMDQLEERLNRLIHEETPV